MICPRCSVAEILPGSNECQLCGYSPARAGKVAVLPPDELDEIVRVELANGFQIERELRRTDDIRTYAAVDATGRTVLLTVIFRSGPRDPASEQRFIRSTEVAKLLDHPHVIPLFDAGIASRFYWTSAKFIEARALVDMLRESGPMDLAVCRRIVEQVGSALDYAHRRGVSHGYLSADCVLVDPNDWAFITNFGLTQALYGFSHTRQGGPMGDQRDLADLVSYALNLVGDEPGIPDEIRKAVERASSPNQGDRYSTILDFVAVLSGGGVQPGALHATNNPPLTRPKVPQTLLMPDAPEPALPVSRRALWIGGGVAVVLALAGWLAWLQLKPAPEPWVTVSLPAPHDQGPPPDSILLPPPIPAARRPAPAPAAVPRATPQAPVAAVPRPEVAEPVVSVTPVKLNGKLFVNSTPWARVYLDDELIGNTPQLDLTIPAGPHMLRVVREGFTTVERAIVVIAGQDLRLTDLVLTRQ